MRIKYLAVAGIILGTLVCISNGALAIVVFFAAMIYYLSHTLDTNDRRFVTTTLIVAFCVRVLLLLAYHHWYLMKGHPDILGPDGEVYSQRGWYISRVLFNHNIFQIPSTEYIFTRYNELIEFYKGKLPGWGEYQIGAFSYFIAFVYGIFDYSPLIIKLFNCFASVATGVYVYKIGKECFNAPAGKAAMLLFLFLPSIVMYSITALKDPGAIFLLMVAIWLLIKINKTGNIRLFVPFIAVIFICEFLRSSIKFPMLMVAIISIFIALRLAVVKKLAIVALVLALFAVNQQGLQRFSLFFIPYRLFSSHIGYINTAGNNYTLFPADYYKEGAVSSITPLQGYAAVTKGTVHLLFEPFPWHISNTSGQIAYVQTAALYVAIPLAFWGLLIGLRYRRNLFMPIALYLLFFVPSLAISEGNVGTVFRHRDMLMPFFIILCTGWYYCIVSTKQPFIPKNE